MSKTLLLISQHPQDRDFAAEVAANSVLSLVHAENISDGAEKIGELKPAAVFIDISSKAQFEEVEKAVQEKVGLFSDVIQPNVIHIISDQAIEEIDYLTSSPLFGHYIQRNFGDVKSSALYYSQIVRATLQDRAFGLKSLLRPQAKIQTIKLQSSSQKQEAVEAVRSFLIQAKFQSRMATVVANAVDEILMNAMFDAPIDMAGQALYSTMTRSSVLALEGKAEVEFQLGYDGEWVALTAIDHYGSLDKTKLFSHVTKVYKEEEYKVRSSIASAGIGLATVFRSGGSLLFVSENRARTEVTVFFRKTDSFRSFKYQFKFLSTQFYF